MPFVLGWEEWLALPELGLPAVKAKVDTGARTSSLSAFAIQPIGTPEQPRVQFSVRPVPGRDDIVVACVADVVDRRDVTSSNGEKEQRYVIRTLARMGEREWPIEVTLTDREAMAYRMLLGRQAVADDMVVEPGTSFRQPKLSYRRYGLAARSEAVRQPLTIAILSRRPENAGNRRLVRQGEQRGHAMPIVDRRRLSLFVAAREPAILVNGLPLEPPDAVIFRAGRAPSAFSLAIVRQMQAMGTLALNPADALAMAADGLWLRQTLAAAGVEVPEVAVNPRDLGKGGGGVEHMLADSLDALGGGRRLRFAVIGGRALTVIERPPPTALDDQPEWQAVDASTETASGKAELKEARALAERAARAVGLGLAAVEVALSRTGALVVDMTANLSISQFERLTGAALAEAVIVHLEQAIAARGRRSAAALPTR